MKQQVKPLVAAFLLQDPKNAELPFKKAFEKFIKSSPDHEGIREVAFKFYYDQVQAGILTENDLKRAPRKISKDEVKVKIYNTDREKKNVPKDLFIPYKTGKAVDIIFSEDGGIMKGTTIVITGGAGVGKSTIMYDIQSCLKAQYPTAKMICVNSEMRETDLQYERRKKEWLRNVDFCLLSDPRNVPNIKDTESPYMYAAAILETIFTSGYDIVFLDSFEDICDKLETFCDMKSTEAEMFLLALCHNANDGKNNNDVRSAIISIQQVTKGGVFTGSNKIKHSTTGMLHLHKDESGRYAEFSKNRRCGEHVDKKMYYSLNEKREVMWDQAAFEAVDARAVLLKEEKKKLQENADKFFSTVGRPDEEKSLKGRKSKVEVEDLEFEEE